MPAEKDKTTVQSYYRRRESRWGYKYLLKGTKHYGYYPSEKNDISLIQSQRLMEEVLGKQLGLPAGARVLDAGCGEGFVAMNLADKFGYQITGIDILPEAIVQADKNKRQSPSVSFRQGDFSRLDFPANSFDGIYTIETFVHTPDYRKNLKEFYRVLKPGGVIVHFEYVMDDHMPEEVEDSWRVMYEGSSMNTLQDFRVSRIESIWQSAGFKNVSQKEITPKMVPFMKRLYQIAFLPYHILRLLGKERDFVNTYAGYKSYKNRKYFHYTIIKAFKP